MKFSVDYEKLSELGKYSIEKGTEIDKLFADIVSILQSIDENWKSEDSSVYIKQLLHFLDIKSVENNDLFDMGNALGVVSSGYSSQDEKWANDLNRKEQSRNEQ